MTWTRDLPIIPSWYWFNGIADKTTITIEIVELNYGDKDILLPSPVDRVEMS